MNKAGSRAPHSRDGRYQRLFAFVQQVSDDEVPAELRRRYVQSLP